MDYSLSQYVAAGVETSSPTRIVVQLYQRAIADLRVAQAALARGDFGEKGEALGHAHAVVTELQATLDGDPAPELAAKLEALYDFVLDRIVRANSACDASLLAPARAVLEELLVAWIEVASKVPHAGAER